MAFSQSIAEARIAAAIAGVAVLVRLVGVLRAVKLLEGLIGRRRPLLASASEELMLARRIGRRVNVAAARMPGKPRCLVRSMATMAALRRHGMPADLQVGITYRDTFEAHAWVELHGEPINDTPEATSAYRSIWRSRQAAA